MTTVEGILTRYNLVWRLNPYRIEHVNGEIVQAGPNFDLRDDVLKADQRRAVERKKKRQLRAS